MIPAMTTFSILAPAERRFLEDARTATLATIAPSGRPRLVPVCFILMPAGPAGATHLYSPLDDKPKQSDDPHDLARVRDILVLPVATLLVERWSEDWDRLAWVRLECRGEILEPEPRERDEHAAAAAALLAKYPQYASHRLADRPILRFRIDRVVAWGDLGGT
jgi:PPOX class probable F420-dependent enzyme